MTSSDLLRALLDADTAADVETLLEAFEAESGDAVTWKPVGDRTNNRGPIEVSQDPGRSLVERVTNGIDAILEAEFEAHGGVPECRTPSEAAIAWLGVPARGLSVLTTRQRQVLADRLIVRIGEGSGRDARLVEVRDKGIGIPPADMAGTILSLNESNKIQKHYLVGTYGQGGSSTFAVSHFTLIASLRDGHPEIGFTVVKFLDLPPEDYKTGHYVYLALSDGVLTVQASNFDFAVGTLVKHFGYDLSPYGSPVGPNSVYGLLQQVLFDPLVPIWLDTSVHRYRRVIKGSRSALNGAVDEGDESTRGPTLAHNIPMFYIPLGDFGGIGVEYWVLESPSQANRRPTASFVNPSRPIILSIHGQNHAELPQSLIRRDAELPFLARRLICHIDCNPLTAAAKRALFPSNREEARRGALYSLIEAELVRILSSDDDLTRLNNEARLERQRGRDEAAIQELRQEVARLLRIHGIDIGQAAGRTAGGTTPGVQPARPHRPRRPLAPIEVHEPPTFIRIVWEADEPIDFYRGQRRYIRLETDANSTYHSPDNPATSRINLIASEAPLSLRGSTPLAGGRMRVILDASADAAVGQTGTFRIELMRPGLPSLSDEKPISIVERPPERPGPQTLTLPPFDVVPVAPDEDQWAELDWPDNTDLVASSAEMVEGTLTIYYSTVFPKYLAQLRRHEQRDPESAHSFTSRYEVWLATHSLLFHQDEQDSAPPDQGQGEQAEALAESHERAERCRIATIAALVAAREIDMGAIVTEAENAE